LNEVYSRGNNRQRPRPEDPIKANLVYNERIRHDSVRLVGKDDEQLGVMPFKQALWQARNEGLDIVEVTANATPPVCKLTELNKYIYNLRRQKKEKDKKIRENAIVIKEIHLRPVTDKHDIEVKQSHARKFLDDNAKVKIMIKFKGRELSFREKGFELMQNFITGLEPCKIEKSPELNGKAIISIIAPANEKRN